MIHAQDPSVQTFTLETGNLPLLAAPIYETGSRVAVTLEVPSPGTGTLHQFEVFIRGLQKRDS